MPYLGNDLQVAQPSYRNIDDISGSFNSSTTSFPLLVSGSAPVPFPINSNQCLISVAGVVQRPDDSGTEGFRISSGNIIFSSAPSTGADFFGVILAGADYVNVGANFPSGSAAVPSITFDSDLDTGIYNSAANQVSIATAGTERLRIDSAGQIESVSLGSASAPAFSFTTDPNTGVYSPGADQVAISTNGSGRLFVDASGRVLVGTSTSLSTNAGFTPNLQVAGTVTDAAMSVFQYRNATGAGGSLTLSHSRGASVGTQTILQNGDSFGILLFEGSDGTNPVQGALIKGEVDGTPGTNDMPGRIVLSTTADGASSPTERMRIDSSGRVGIGTASASKTLHVYSSSFTFPARIETNGTGSGIELKDGTTGANAPTVGAIGDNFYVTTSNQERARIDSSGRLLVGTSTARSNIDSPWGNFTPSVQFETTNNGVNGLSIIANATDGYPGEIVLGCSRGSSAGSNTAVQISQRVGQISFQGADGTNLIEAAEIKCEIDATPGANDMPGRLVFSTTADGASSPTERMRIRNDGFVFVGKTTNDGTVSGFEFRTTPADEHFIVTNTRLSGGECMILNRQTGDGTLLVFSQANTTEGSISVSGTTVSYNGAHLSRWSQLPGGAQRTEILRGSVLSNIDEMCEWGDEDNEQLNRMKVSDVEGDKNISGVFQCWDDDDTYTNDFYCAMTGDFIIRIGADTTVERGDLLMSAGDGTAKPQDDDIIRSKTIAKVTSTNVSCTYDDGSYCVPCVLMAC